MRPLLHTSPHFANLRVHSHVSLFRRKFGALKVVYRGSAAGFLALLGFCANPGIPPQKPQKVNYTHLVDFLWLSIMVVLFGGCSSRRFGRSAEQNRGLGGNIRLKSCPNLLLFLLLHGRRPDSGRPSTTLENILPQERYQLVAEKSQQCLPSATQMHTRR